jgi:hypothetical protein
MLAAAAAASIGSSSTASVGGGGVGRRRSSAASVYLAPPPLPQPPIVCFRPVGIVDVHSGPVISIKAKGPWVVSIASDESLVIRRLDQFEDAPWRYGQALRERILGAEGAEPSGLPSEEDERQRQRQEKQRKELLEVLEKRHRPMPWQEENEAPEGKERQGDPVQLSSKPDVGLTAAAAAPAPLQARTRPRLAGGSRAVIIPPFRQFSASWDQCQALVPHMKTLLAASLNA